MPRLSLPVLLTATVLSFGLQAQLPVIRAVDAKLYTGREVVVEDVVAQVSAEPQSGFVYLNFGGDFPNHLFRAVIPSDVEARLDARIVSRTNVRVTGIPRVGATGRPEILCAAPIQLALASGASPALGLLSTPTPAGTPAPTRKCCRTCSSGKPCGDSCIARTATCRQPPGCACLETPFR